MVEGAGEGEDEAGSIKEGRVEVEGGGEVEEGVRWQGKKISPVNKNKKNGKRIEPNGTQIERN